MYGECGRKNPTARKNGCSRRLAQRSSAVYFSAITELDAQFGQLMQDIEAAGQQAETIVIVIGDHGRYLGAHGLDAHNFGAFEEIYRIPLIMAGPGIAAGATSSALVGLHDLCPTLLELADAQPISAADSRSFAPALRDPARHDADFDEGYAEYHGTRFGLTQRILWQGAWKFIFNGFDEDEFYNLQQDPFGLCNLARRADQQERCRAMMAAMWRIMRRTGDNTLVGTHYSPYRFAPVGPLA